MTIYSTSTVQSRSAMGLPDRFIRTPKRALKLSKDCSMPFEASKPNYGAPDWNVPTTGGFAGGYKTGSEIAFAVLKQRRNKEFQQANKHQFANIVQSMIARHGQIDKDDKQALSAFNAQTRAFADLIGVAVDYYLGCEDSCHEVLDGTSMEEILSDANRGLGLNSKKYEAWLYGNDKAENATLALAA